MKIALIADILTYDSLLVVNDLIVKRITPLNYKIVLKLWSPDFLFVESAWQGHKNKWKFKIAAYPDYPNRNNHTLQRVVRYAKKLGIPTVFWNKEDGIHFDRFIESAKLFDYIFTVDENCIKKYESVVDKDTKVNTLMFSVQSKIHYFNGFNFKFNKANFVGSYSTHIHDKRREWQDIMFLSAHKVRMDVAVFDRNSNRKSQNYRYPNFSNLEVLPAVPYVHTAQIYKDYALSLNVNTIEDSPTMFSRRLIEILACGGIAVTNPSQAVNKMFEDYCHIVHCEEEMRELFHRIKKDGVSKQDKEMARAGAEYVAKYHTWTHRIDEIRSVIGI